MTVLFALEDDRVETGLSWFLADEYGRAIAVAADELELQRADETVMIVSGQDVFIGEIDAVARSEKELRTAALYQLEDDLAEPVSKLHIALGEKPVGTSHRRRVAVISDARMAQLVSALEDAGFPGASQAKIIPDTSLLLARGEAVLWDGDGRVLLCDGSVVYAVDGEVAIELVPALLQSMEASGLSYISGPSPALADSASVQDVIQARTEVSGYADFIAQLLTSQSGIDLRQDMYASRKSVKVDARGWIGSLVLAGVALAAWVGYLGVSTLHLEGEADRLYDVSVQAYRTAYPAETRVVDPLKMTRARLTDVPGSGAGGKVSGLLTAFYKGLEDVEGVQLESFNYSASTGRLTANLRFSSYQDRDQLKRVFEESGLSLDLAGVSQNNGVLSGQAVIERGL